jgi:hypothetical protein
MPKEIAGPARRHLQPTASPASVASGATGLRSCFSAKVGTSICKSTLFQQALAAASSAANQTVAASGPIHCETVGSTAAAYAILASRLALSADAIASRATPRAIATATKHWRGRSGIFPRLAIAVAQPQATWPSSLLLAICETGDALPIETCIRRGAGIAAQESRGCLCPGSGSPTCAVGVGIVPAHRLGRWRHHRVYELWLSRRSGVRTWAWCRKAAAGSWRFDRWRLHSGHPGWRLSSRAGVASKERY